MLSDIPILPTVTAKITFQEFEFKNDIPQSLFEIPDDYIEDPTRWVLFNLFSLYLSCEQKKNSDRKTKTIWQVLNQVFFFFFIYIYEPVIANWFGVLLSCFMHSRETYSVVILKQEFR